MKNKQDKQDRHGSPWDRGNADYYYGRLWSPHYYKGASMVSQLIQHKEMTEEEVTQYTEGYHDQTAGQKDWGVEIEVYDDEYLGDLK